MRTKRCVKQWEVLAGLVEVPVDPEEARAVADGTKVVVIDKGAAKGKAAA